MPTEALGYSLRFRAPVGVMTGLGIAGLVDRTVVRDGGGHPYIPGSTVKGRLRFFAERVLWAKTPPEPYRVHDSNGPVCKAPGTACTLCRLFGGQGLRGIVQVGPARLAEPWDELLGGLRAASGNPVVSADAEIRPGVALSRLRRTALKDHLFFDETVPAVEFEGTIRLRGSVSEEELRFLRGVGRLVRALGARKAAGRGVLSGGIEIGGGEVER